MRTIKLIKTIREAERAAGLTRRNRYEVEHGAVHDDNGCLIFLRAHRDVSSHFASQTINLDFSLITIRGERNIDTYRRNVEHNRTIFVASTNYFGDTAVGEYTVEVEGDDVVRLRAL